MQQYKKLLLIGVPVLFVIGIAVAYFFSGRYVSTDNAYLQAAKAGVNANLPGQVIEVYVKDNQAVQKGDKLFKLDDRPHKIALDNAKAQLTDARLKVLVLRATYLQALAKMREAEHNYNYAEREFERQKKLAASGISSDMQLNKASNDFQMVRQEYYASKEALAAALANLNNDPKIEQKDHPLVQEAQANWDRANLNLEYTLITAPFDGIVTKVDLLQPGDFIGAGEPVFAIISNENIWIEANFKETQITYMKPDQRVTIKMDAYPDLKLSGRIESLSPGTGSTFSLLPPENATGNWVKIIQRVPVRISLNKVPENVLLASGLSATVTVDTGHR